MRGSTRAGPAPGIQCGVSVRRGPGSADCSSRPRCTCSSSPGTGRRCALSSGDSASTYVRGNCIYYLSVLYLYVKEVDEVLVFHINKSTNILECKGVTLLTIARSSSSFTSSPSLLSMFFHPCEHVCVFPVGLRRLMVCRRSGHQGGRCIY